MPRFNRICLILFTCIFCILGLLPIRSNEDSMSAFVFLKSQKGRAHLQL